MTDQKLDEETIISDSFSLYRERVVGLPERPEDPSRWHPPTIKTKAVCQRYNATPTELADWETRRGFPRPKALGLRFLGWKNEFVAEWALEDLETWESEIRQLAARFPSVNSTNASR